MIPHYDLTDNERASAAWDAYLCQNLMARFVYYQELGMEEDVFDTLWSQRNDISLGENEGFMVGRSSVRAYWIDNRREMRQADLALLCASDASLPGTALGAGSMERFNLMSPLIEVARDGKTAKGMWYCPGADTQSEADGQMHLCWHYVRYVADFIKEEDDWKLWHLFRGSEFRFEMGHAYIPATGMKPLPDATVYSQNPATAGMPLGRELKQKYDLPIHLYSIDYGWSQYPVVPVPYEHFEETFSYGPEPFLPN